MASERIQKILTSVSDKVQRLMDLDRFYVALYDSIRAELEFPLVVDKGDLAETGQTPWTMRPYQGYAWLPDRVIDQQAPLLFEHDLVKEIEEAEVEYWPPDGYPQSWLGVPMIFEKQVIGILVAENRRKAGAFGERGKGVLSTVARQAAVAIESARLYERLERKITSRSALNEIGQRLTASIRLSEPEILELIYQQASRVMDTDNMYIALYDGATDTVWFPLAFLGGRPVDVAEEEGWQPRQAGKGRTEWIIRYREPLFSFTSGESKAWYKQPGRREYIGQPFASWIGVPMIVGEEVLGVIATYHATQEYVYDEDDLEILSLMASQAAVALENARLYAHLVEVYQDLREAQERRIEAERFAYLGHAADGIAHRINNTVALLPLCVRDIKKHMVTVDAIVNGNLEMIARNARYVLDLAEELQKPSRPSEAGRFDINLLIKEAIDVASPPSEIEVITKLAETLPEVQTKKLLIDVFVELITNAVEAMTGCANKVLEIGSRLAGDKYVEVWFTDTGKGIPEEEQERLFELFYTTAEKKEPTVGVAKGFGLWWIKTFLAWQGGEISVESKVGKKTTFVVKLPVEVQS